MSEHEPQEGLDAGLDADIRDAYQRGEPGDDAAAARTIARWREAGTRPPAGRLARWFSPRPVVLSPALAAGGVVVALALAVLAGTRFGRGTTHLAAPIPRSAIAAADGVPVVLVLRAPGATRVSVAGDFNGWDAEATPMARAGSGDTWTVQLSVPRGVHLYSFVLDGREWTPDPSAPLAAEASFGTRNSVLVAGEGAAL